MREVRGLLSGREAAIYWTPGPLTCGERPPFPGGPGHSLVERGRRFLDARATHSGRDAAVSWRPGPLTRGERPPFPGGPGHSLGERGRRFLEARATHSGREAAISWMPGPLTRGERPPFPGGPGHSGREKGRSSRRPGPLLRHKHELRPYVHSLHFFFGGRDSGNESPNRCPWRSRAQEAHWVPHATPPPLLPGSHREHNLRDQSTRQARGHGQF
ncbi:uncharacterized protein LOC134358885 [Mobula hypostoma]|uniref:uncharacterized protein LOC134358885 n=1 Tax=Mobula hypostoma TaxID=723540 RepID=UPI002FC3D67E